MAEEDTDDATVESDLLTKLKKWYRRDYEHLKEWRTEAHEDYDFVAGEQYTEEEKAALKEQLRPVITFNRVAPIVNAVSGTEITNRQEVKYIPREVGDVKNNEILTSAAQWFRDQTDADEEDSEAFLDAAICGIGVTETRMSFDTNKDGDPSIQRIDPLYCLWDCNAKRRNLTDRRRQWYVTQISLEEAKEEYPDADPWMLNAVWAADIFSDHGEPHDQDESDEYAGTTEEGQIDDDDLITLAMVQWYEYEDFWRVADKDTQEMLELSPEEYRIYNEANEARFGVKAKAVKQRRRVYKQATLGREVLKVSGTPRPGHFSFNFITGWRDRNKGTFYGIVRPMKDPARWSNKWMSQTMHILNNNAKGGVTVEKGAVSNAREFEDSWARAERVTYVENGALQGGRIAPKPVGQFPAGFYQLMEMAIDAGRDVSGISLEMLGMREVDQPGVLEYQRKQQGVVLLATLFSSLRMYRREQGRLLLDHIIHDMGEDRIIPIVGEGEAQYVRLGPHDLNVEYDVIVDDAPTSPNQKQMVWAFFGPQMANYPPPIQAELLKFSPLPTSVVEKIGQLMVPKPSPEQARMANMDMAQKEAEVIKLQSEAQENLTQAYDAWMQALERARMLGMPAPPELPQAPLNPVHPQQPPQPQTPPQQPPGPPGPPNGAGGMSPEQEIQAKLMRMGNQPGVI